MDLLIQETQYTPSVFFDNESAELLLSGVFTNDYAGQWISNVTQRLIPIFVPDKSLEWTLSINLNYVTFHCAKKVIDLFHDLNRHGKLTGIRWYIHENQLVIEPIAQMMKEHFNEIDIQLLNSLPEVPG